MFGMGTIHACVHANVDVGTVDRHLWNDLVTDFELTFAVKRISDEPLSF